MKNCLFVCVSALLIFAGNVVHAQSLEAVLSSVQERHVALEQRDQVSSRMEATYPGEGLFSWVSNNDLDDIEAIDWEVTANKYPTDLSSLSLEDRVKALNLAIKALDRIKLQYVNVAVASIDGQTAAPADIVTYSELDVPSLGRADHRNYHAKLRALALQVDKLRVLEWPFRGNELRRRSHYYDDKLSNRPSIFSHSLAQEGLAGPYAIDAPPTPYTQFNPLGGRFVNDLVTFEGDYDDQTAPSSVDPYWSTTHLIIHNSKFMFRVYEYGAPAPSSGIDLLDGEAVLFAKDHYNPTTGVKRGGVEVSLDARLKRIGSVQMPSSQSQDVEIAIPDETLEYDGTWQAIGSPYNVLFAEACVPTGRSLDEIKAAPPQSSPYADPATAFGSLKGYDPFFVSPDVYDELYSDSLQGYVIHSRTYRCLVKPSFQKGLDTNIAVINALKAIPQTNAANPDVAIAPSPSLLWEVNLGSGNANTQGWGSIGLKHPKHTEVTHFPHYPFKANMLAWLPWLYTPNFVEAENLDPQYATFAMMPELVFIGAQQDFHVVYNTSRSSNDRAELPDWEDGGNTKNWNEAVHGWVSSGHFLAAWDKPRLRQVVGKQIAADIEYPAGGTKTDYKYTIKLTRVPPNANMTPDAQGLINTSSFPVIRTLTIENPQQSNGWPSADVYSLAITDAENGNNEKWTLKADDASGTSDLANWTLETEKGSQQNLKVTWGWDETAGKLTSNLWSGTGASAARTTETTFQTGEDWYSPLARPQTIVVAPGSPEQISTAFTYSSTASYTELAPEKITTTNSQGANSEVEWSTSGIPLSSESGSWKTTYSIEGGGSIVKATHQLGISTYATTWHEQISANQYKIYSAPNGTITDKSDAENAISTIDLHAHDATPIPWALSQATNRDGSGSISSYAVTGNSITLTTESGLISGSSVTEGSKTVMTYSDGFPASYTQHLVSGGADVLLVDSATWGNPNAWGAPEQRTPIIGDLASSWSYDGAWNRIASSTDGLGVVTNNIQYDALGRVTNYDWNGLSGSIDFEDGGKTIDHVLNVPGGANRGSKVTTNSVGAPVTASDYGRQQTNYTFGYQANDSTVEVENLVTGAKNDYKYRATDGSLENSGSAATSNVEAFGGTTGDALTVVNGLLKSRRVVAGLSASYETIYTDAWGRVQQVETPSTQVPLLDTTLYTYSNPAQLLKRVTVDYPSGISSITESEPYASGGPLSRSGIDTDPQNGSLGGTDRYTETVTSYVGSSIKTTTKHNEDSGMRVVLEREYTPSTGATKTISNQGESEITSTPNYTTKQVTTDIKQNGTNIAQQTDAFNNLGQTETSTLTGASVPTTTTTTSFQADGSVNSITSNEGTASSSIALDNTGKLSSLVDPLLGNIFGGHSYLNGEMSLTINGTTHTSKFDGTNNSVSGADVMAQTRTKAISGNNVVETINPATGSSTGIVRNAAGAKITKDYATGTDPSQTWNPNGFIDTVTTGRAANIQFAYSTDGAMDLSSITYPSVSSAGFTTDSNYYTHSFTYDTAGRVKTVTDGTGNRNHSYNKGRLSQVEWLGGDFSGYEIERQHDGNGRLATITFTQPNGDDSTIIYNYEGASNELKSITTAGFTATYTRNTDRVITQVSRGGVNQTWARGTAGRITSAGNNAGAATFNYNTFDTQGRRKDAVTAGNTWNYTYGTAGQLTSASHPTLGSFSYNLDGIGRRSDAGNNNLDPLNQFKGMQHSQQRKLFISADPAARLWINGVEMTPFNGGWIYNLSTTDPNGGWVPWSVQGVLEGAGDPGAGPDAKALITGITYIPPAQENFTYDADGNRESSALWNYQWDSRNRLVRARTKNHLTVPEGIDVTFDYDAEGRRYKKDVKKYDNGNLVSHTLTTFVWDGWDLLYEIKTDVEHGNTTLLERKYVWGEDLAGGGASATRTSGAGGAGGLLLIRETKDGITDDYYPLYDGTGHVVGLTDAAGTLVADYAYGPFGESIHAYGQKAEQNPWRYATKYFDTETGLYYFGHRYFDPVSGQWLSREPLGEDESLNLYAYCLNDPINCVDYLGLASVIVNGGGVTGVGLLDGTLESSFVGSQAKSPGMKTAIQLFAMVDAQMRYDAAAVAFESAYNRRYQILGDRPPFSEALSGRGDHPAYQANTVSRLIAAGVPRGVDPNFYNLVANNFLWVSSKNYEYLEKRYQTQYEFENAPGHRLREIVRETVNLPGHAVALVGTAASGSEITTGNAIVFNGWGQGFGLYEVSEGERAFAAALTLMPFMRAGSFGDDLYRIGSTGRRISVNRMAKFDDGIPNTGVAKYDQLAVDSKYFGKFISGVESRGFKVVKNPNLVSDRAHLRMKGNRPIFEYNPTTFNVLDMRHEIQHFNQFKIYGPSMFRLNNIPAMERAAYSFELRLGNKAGFSSEYMNWAQGRLGSF